jgi:anti-sigma-K factor RskA
MIDDAGQDLAIEYLLGGLESEALREFEGWMQSDAELRKLVDELRESLAAVANLAPPVAPPPGLRTRILAVAGGEALPVVAASEAPRSPVLGNWLPWSIAAGLAVTSGFLYADRSRWRAAADRTTAEVARATAAAQQAQDNATSYAERLLVYETQAKSQGELVAELREEIANLRGRDALAQVKIASLSSQVAEFGRAGVVVVWDPEDQRGVIKLANLPQAGEGKDYQLWIIDPKYPSPVNGGILPVAADGTAKLAFRPDQPIASADKFAISVEQAGGVPKAEGPIVFIGD